MDKKNKNPNVPNLRFSSFADPFRIYTLKEVLQRISFPVTVDENKLYYQIGIRSHSKGIFYKEAESGKQIGNKRIFWIEPNCLILNIVFAWEQAVAKTSEKEVGMVASHRFPMYKVLNNSLDYIVDFFKTEKGKQLLQMASPGGAGRNKTLNQDFFLSSKIYLPSLTEQLKTSELIELIEDRIETQIKIIELKQSLIKDIEDRILWKTTNTQTKPIREFLTEINNKSIIQNQYPLLSSTKKGLFLQTDYFNKEAASSNNIGYKIVHKGDIIISPQNLWMGNITYNDKFDNGLVSPSYRIYKVKEEYNAFYISRILMSYRALSLYKNISEQGASIVRRNLNVDAFNELCFPIPNIKKQDEVGLFLSKLHQELKCETWILMQLKSQKNYLLNNMFI